MLDTIQPTPLLTKSQTYKTGKKDKKEKLKLLELKVSQYLSDD